MKMLDHKVLTESPKVPRRPALWATTFLAIGILIDSCLNSSPVLWWATITICGLGFLLQGPGNSATTTRSLSLLLLFMAVGGVRHHEFQSVRQQNNIQGFAQFEPAPVRLVGIICSSIDIIEAEHGPGIPPWMEVDTSRFQFEVEQIADGESLIKASGVVRVDLNGHLIHARIGDRIELLGEISKAAPPKNPGDFDFQKYLARQGVDALCRVKHPQAITVVGDPHPWRWKISRLRESIREEARKLFTLNLSKPAKIIALSLLLGDRSQLNDELRTKFAESGAMHLLAISGLHVGILAGLIAVLCRTLNFSLRTSRILIVVVVVLFAMLTNHRPPVLRATMLISILALGTTASRRVDGFNVLAFCAGILLLWKPTDLFDIGAQLSFLAVGGIIWSSSFLRKSQTNEDERLPTPEGRRWLDALRPILNFFYQGYVITAAIWFATLPLTMAVFNLVSPIGYLLNVLLIPYAALTLSFGYLFLFAGLLFPASGRFLAIPFDYLVQGLLAIVERAKDLPFGHYQCDGFQTWWLIGYYVLLAITWKLFPSLNLGKLNSYLKPWKLIAIWIAIGFLAGPQTPLEPGLRYTVLSVGHGLASVIELPTGETILYDAGTFGDGRRAERSVENYLRSRGTKHIDAIIVSHADHDHFSGMFGLLEQFSVGTMIVSEPFLDFEQSSVKELCETAASSNIPRRIVQAGDTLEIHTTNDTIQNAQLKILHPAIGFNSKHDNANSIVLEIDYAGRRILLTGDLEKDGTTQIIGNQTKKYDVVMAPHHGSKYSSPQEFFDWANPKYVLVSSGDATVTQRLQEQLGPTAKFYGTQTSGALTVEIAPNGELSVIPFIDE